jgi:hypothetical protein
MNPQVISISRHFTWTHVRAESVHIGRAHPFAGYAHSKILKRPRASMSYTITMPRQPQRSTSSAASNSTSQPPILYPAAFNRAKAFIKTILKNELELLNRDSSEVPLMFSLVQRAKGSKSAIVERCKRQLEAYARNQWPFNTGSIGDNVDTLTWWEQLVFNDSTDVLAVWPSPSRMHLQLLIWILCRQLPSRSFPCL